MEGSEGVDRNIDDEFVFTSSGTLERLTYQIVHLKSQSFICLHKH